MIVMKTKLFIPRILFIWTMALFWSCSSHQNIMNRLSSDIYDTQTLTFGEGIFLKGINIYLQRSKWHEELNFSLKNDTIFLLEYPSIEGNYCFAFWNKKDTLTYPDVLKNLEFYHGKTPFTKYMMKLVSEWNILAIREEEILHPVQLPSGIVYATRIIIRNGKYKIDCIDFKDFFDFKRDNIDLSN